MQRQTAQRSRQVDGADADGAAVAAPAAPPPCSDSPAVVALLGRWLDLSELERRSFTALTRELTVASDLVETSTLDLSARFQELAAIAQGQMQRVDSIIAAAQSIEVEGKPVPLASALHAVEDVLKKVIETILAISKHAMRMVYALDDVARDVEGAGQCVSQIEAINTQTRYLALNAAIEANRSGAAGAAFQVIAREIKDLSRATDETSRQVRQRIAAVTGGMKNGHTVLQEIATLDLSEHITAKERLDLLMQAVIAKNEAFTAVLTSTSDSSAAMARTIGQLIVGMQFQDRTKQHLGQVIDTLGVLGEATVSLQRETRAENPGAFAPAAIDEAWLKRILHVQTLGAVRQRLLTRLLKDPAEHPAEADPAGSHGGDDIELF